MKSVYQQSIERVLEEGQFSPDSCTWGPFSDGRHYQTGVVAGPGGARQVEVTGASGITYLQWEGMVYHASRTNGVVRREK